MLWQPTIKNYKMVIRAIGSILKNQSGQGTWSVGLVVAKLDYNSALHSETQGQVYGEEVSCQSKLSCIAAQSRGSKGMPRKNFEIFLS